MKTSTRETVTHVALVYGKKKVTTMCGKKVEYLGNFAIYTPTCKQCQFVLRMQDKGF